MRFSTLDDWLAWLEQLHPETIELGLERIATVAQRLELLPLDPLVITVAGTNGKGSTIAALQALLGVTVPEKRIGVYTSPHLQHFCERIAIDGQPVEESVLCGALQRVDDARNGISLTYFEFTTLAALLVFADSALDVVLLEVGLGGRLDAVNIVDADIAVITTIALDHQAWLGDDRESIGREKAGILRRDRPAFVADPEPPQTVLARAEALHCTLFRRDEDYSVDEAGESWCWRGVAQQRDTLPAGHLPKASWATALAVIEQLDGLPQRAVLAALIENTRLAGRMQEVSYAGRHWLLDVAHNPQAVTYLAEYLRQRDLYGMSAVFALMADKDLEPLLDAVGPHIDSWHLPAMTDIGRAMPAGFIGECLRSRGIANAAIHCHSAVADSINAAIQATGAGDKILVFGSFYLVGDALQQLGQSAFPR